MFVVRLEDFRGLFSPTCHFGNESPKGHYFEQTNIMFSKIRGRNNTLVSHLNKSQ